MQQFQKEPDNLKKYILKLISNVTNLYKSNYASSQMKKQTIESEIFMIKKLNIEEIRILLQIFDKLYVLNEPFSLLDDISNISNLNPVIERINFILNEEFLLKDDVIIKDPLLSQISIALKETTQCKNEFEFELRTIYFNLLNKHISSSNGTSNDYQDYLKNLLKILKFKYPQAWYHNPNINVHNYETENIKVSYLHFLIEKVIKCLLEYKDHELEVDLVYAKAMSLQIFLRSLLIILNNEHEMIAYEEMYNTLQPKETLAKTIIRNAFIANYVDSSEYTLSKKGD